MEHDYTNRKGQINNLDDCGEILRTRNQYNLSTEALAIDYANKQFALFDGMALSTSRSNSRDVTHKEVKERLRLLIRESFEEADLKHNRYGQIDYRRYLPEFRKELATEMRAKAVSAKHEIDIEKTLEETKKQKSAIKNIQKEKESGRGLER